MKYYQEVTILASFEVPVDFIWSKVYQQLHIGFAALQDSEGRIPIGVSFPQYRYDNGSGSVGEKMRIFANQLEVLEKLRVKKLLQRLQDYVHVTAVREIPESPLQYATYQRIHQKGNPEQKARRFVKRHQESGITYDQAVTMFSQKVNVCRFPYVRLKSLTNHQSFNLFIAKTQCEQAVYSGFSSYGLSDTSTVPDF